ncbi:MAG: peptidylprolyl isomerase [Burkholderiaceae bacterium]|nr:peptidylprolyl isomerase [Microbacteriaceae bacterium]
MAPSKNVDREAREARMRMRRFAARQRVHAHQVARRRRDNILAVTAVVVIATLAAVAQIYYFSAGPGTPEPVASPSASPSASPDAVGNVGNVPSAEIAAGRAWTGDLTLNGIDLGIRIDGDLAPQAASVFISLQQSGYYTNNACQRLTTSDQLKVLQCGQPNLEGSPEQGFSFGPLENVPADGVYPAGTIAMARAATPESMSTQFFITYGDSVLDTAATGGGYTVFGQVTSGLDEFVAQIASAGVTSGGSSATDGQPAIATTITSLTLQ